jgi:hypothetical protein
MTTIAGDVVSLIFTTNNPSTGALANSSVGPAGTIYQNGVATATVVTVSNVTTGVYKAVFTLSTTIYTAGDEVQLYVTATVGGVAGGSAVWTTTLDSPAAIITTASVAGVGGFTLWDATLDLAQILMQVYQGTATGGTTATVVDTSIDEPSNYFGTTNRNGTLWLDLATNASKAITGHTTTTLTFTPAQTNVVAANDVYYAAPPDFPRSILIQSVNQALMEMGPYPVTVEKTATIDQQEYDSDDDSVYEEHIIAIEIANDTTAPYNWTPMHNWRQEELTKRTLVFEQNYVPTHAFTMRITYLGNHSTLSTDAGIVNRLVKRERLKWQAAKYALLWKIQHTKGDEDHWKEMLQNAVAMAAKETARFPIEYDDIKLANW